MSDNCDMNFPGMNNGKLLKISEKGKDIMFITAETDILRHYLGQG